MSVRIAATFILISVAPASAMAQEKGWYLGAGFGQSNARGGCSGATVPVHCEDTDMAGKLFAGIQANRYLAFELGYTDLGEIKATPTPAPGVIFVPTSASIKTSGIELTGMGMLPLSEHVSLFARAGVFSWKVNAVDAGTGNSSSASGSSATYGLGVKADFTPTIMVRAEWQRYLNVGDQTTGQGDFDFIGVGLAFKF